MSCPKVLREAIEGLYEAFSGYPLPENVEHCNCCHAPDANDLLRAAPLRELAWEHLSDFVDSALLTYGVLEDFKHFLPRIFELLVTDPDGSPGVEATFKRFRYGKWREWPRGEQEAVQKFLDAIWETIRSNPPLEGGFIDIDTWLCSLGLCDDDLSRYLKTWDIDERLSASWALSSLVLASEIAYTGDDYEYRPSGSEEERAARLQEWWKLPRPSAWWADGDAAYRQLEAWVRSPSAMEKLWSAEVSCGNPEMEREFATAQACLRNARSVPFVRAYRDRPYQSMYWEAMTARLF